MPFITHNRRTALALGELPESVGDLCYLAYKEMVRCWSLEPKWTTAHFIYRNVCTVNFWERMFEDVLASNFEEADFKVAIDLAWQVFFQNYVMPYEREKEKDNGTI